MKDKFFHIEEEFHSLERKLDRKERRRVSLKDRSKFKKSDQDLAKKHKQLPSGLEECKKGKVLSISIEGIIVESEHALHICTLKGSLKKDNLRLKNLVAVGDNVYFQPSQRNQGVIIHIGERHSILSKADSLAKTKQQIIAVNIDQVIITASIGLPQLKPFLIDRYIIAARKGELQPIIVINKIDLLPTASEEEKELYKTFLSTYEKLGIPLYPVSTLTGEGMSALKEAMVEKSSVFSGQSGVGKSSLINLLADASLDVGKIVEKTSKGSHTTTATHLIPLKEGGFCIDTPGVRSFGIWEVGKEEVQAYFPEIKAVSQECKYPDCAHQTEPGCAVKEAVEKGEIAKMRFDSYIALIESIALEDNSRR